MNEEQRQQRVALGRYIRELREDHDPEITQAQASKAACVSRQHWNRIERGEAGTERDTLIRIAEALGVDRDDAKCEWLFHLAGFVSPAAQERQRQMIRQPPDYVKAAKDQIDEVVRRVLGDTRMTPEHGSAPSSSSEETRETREPDLDADAPEVLRWYEGLPPDDRAKAKEYIQLLREKYRGRNPRDEE